MPKRVNPRKKPATMADVERAKKKATDEAVTNAMAIMLTVMVDKFNGQDYIADVWKEVCKLSEEVSEGRVSIADLVYVLDTEYDILV